MHENVYFNGSIVVGARIAALSSAALYGRGVFSTIAIHDRQPFLLEKHLRRLFVNTETLGIEVPTRLKHEIGVGLSSLIAANDIVRGRARVTIFDETESTLWGRTDEPKISLLIMTADARSIPAELRLTISPHKINSSSPLAGVKSCNYIEQLVAFDEARSLGFGEALRLNERGHVASACMANVFWENNGKLFTPALRAGCLPGATREFVLENLECEEVEAGMETIDAADRIFLTSAGVGVVGAAEFNGRKLDTSNHPILNLIPN